MGLVTSRDQGAAHVPRVGIGAVAEVPCKGGAVLSKSVPSPHVTAVIHNDPSSHITNERAEVTAKSGRQNGLDTGSSGTRPKTKVVRRNERGDHGQACDPERDAGVETLDEGQDLCMTDENDTGGLPPMTSQPDVYQDLADRGKDNSENKSYLPTPVEEALLLPIREGEKRRVTVGQDQYHIIGGALGELDPHAFANGMRRPRPSTGIPSLRGQSQQISRLPSQLAGWFDDGDGCDTNPNVHRIIVRPRYASEFSSPWPSSDENEPKCGSSLGVVVGPGGPIAKPPPQRPQLQALKGAVVAAPQRVADTVKAADGHARKQPAANTTRSLRCAKAASAEVSAGVPRTPCQAKNTTRKRRRSVAASSDVQLRPAKRPRQAVSSPACPASLWTPFR